MAARRPRRSTSIRPAIGCARSGRRSTVGAGASEGHRTGCRPAARPVHRRGAGDRPRQPQVCSSPPGPTWSAADRAAKRTASKRRRKRDPWDGRATRYEAFIEKLRAATGRADLVVENLDPIVDRLRAVKSPREIAVIREATRIAGVGIMEAMREAEPGMYRVRAPGRRGVRVQETRSAGPGLLCARRHGTEHRLLALSQGHAQTRGR